MNSDNLTVQDDSVVEHSESSIGALQGEVWLTVQTYQAQSLIRGRRSSEGKSAIVGLIGFADRLKSLWQAVRFDDPYADWWLIKVEEAIAASRAQLQQVQEQLESLPPLHNGIEFGIAKSSQPQRVSLQFANPYAFRAAQMLAEFDQICGFENLKVLHLNDSKGALGSHVDRHEHIGMGEVGAGAFKAIVNCPDLAGVPMILETPKGENDKGTPWDTVNLRKLKRMIRDESVGKKRVSASIGR